MDHYLPFRIYHPFKRSFLLAAFIFLNGILLRSSAAVPDSLVMQGTDTVYHLTRNDLKMGERLFYGLIREQADQPSCVSCHNIKPATSFNWNPSAFEIATVYHNRSTGDLKNALLKPVGNKLAEAHAGYGNLNDEQLVQLKGYLYNYYRHGGYQPRPMVNRLLTFSAASPNCCIAPEGHETDGNMKFVLRLRNERNDGYRFHPWICVNQVSGVTSPISLPHS